MILYLIPLIVFLGFICGVLLKKYIPEERKQMQPYLYWAKILLLSILTIFILTQTSFSGKSILFLLFGAIIGFLLKEVYFYLGLALLSLEFFPAVLCFLYGIVSGEKKAFLKTAIFFFLPFVLLLLPWDILFLKIGAAGALLSSCFLQLKMYKQ